MATVKAATLLRHIERLTAPGGDQHTDRQLLEAFAALVARHGPMVLCVCRRALRHVTAAMLLAAGLLAGAGALTHRALASRGPKQATKAPAEDKSTVAYAGRALGPDDRPVAGARLYLTPIYGPAPPHRSPWPEYATTGPDGRFHFTAPKAQFGNRLTFVATAAANYGFGWVRVPAGSRREDLTIRLVRDDVPITGQVVDKPVRGSVEYFALRDNPNLRDYPGLDRTFHRNIVAGKTDGSYRVVGLPRPGLVAVHSSMARYLRAAERDDEYGIKEPSALSTAPPRFHPSEYGALARINPAKGASSAKRDVTLDPGWTISGTVSGPDGKPLAGARGFGVTGTNPWDREGMKTAEFTVRGFSPRRPRDILFRHAEKGLVGEVRPPKENGGSVTVRLVPGATVTGRLVDDDGRPRAGVTLDTWARVKGGWIPLYRLGIPPGRIESNREGRFRIEPLIVGYEFELRDPKGRLYYLGAPSAPGRRRTWATCG